MAKLITINGSIANPLAPRILRTPGVGGYSARFIASHLGLPAGAAVPSWDSVGGTTPMTLGVLGSAPSTLTVGEADGISHVTSPGDSTNGGRLIGPHLAQRPLTIAAVVRMQAGREDFMGVSGNFLTRQTGGTYQGKSGTSTAYTTRNTDGWAFILFAQAADNSFIVQADSAEASQATGGAAPATYGGLFFGATQAGDSADVREIIYWPKRLNATERGQVHAYMKARYPGLS